MTRRRFSQTALAAVAGAILAPRLRAAGVPLPARSVDCHAHLFERGLPLARQRRYVPGYDAKLPQYLSLLDAHGLAAGVLIQPSFLGTDNGYLRQALRRAPDRLRGIAVVEPDLPAGEFAALAADGVVGIRLNLVGADLPPLRSPAWQTLLARVAERDWQVEVHREARDLPGIVDALVAAGVKVVIDHFGRPDPKLGVDDPGFRHLLQAGRDGRVWVKLSGEYRNGGPVRGAEIALAAMPLLLEALGPERLVWGSDWPHTQFEAVANYDGVVAALNRWLPDGPARHRILRDTPRALFHFPPTA